jgi:PKD repeat protein
VGVLLGRAAHAQVPQLLQRELNPVPGQGEERASQPFMWADVRTFGGAPYLFAGRGNAFDLWRLSSPLQPSLVASGIGRSTGLVEKADWDFHQRGLAILDGETDLYAAYYNLGSYALRLNSATAPTAATVVKEYPIYSPAFEQFITNVGSFRDGQGARYLVGRYLLEDGYASGVYATGIYDFSDPAKIVRVRDLPLSDDPAALNSQSFLTFRAGGTPFIAMPAGTPAGALHLLDVTNVNTITRQRVDPPAGYTRLEAKAYDPASERLALAFGGSGKSPLVVVYQMQSVIGVITPVELKRGVVPDLSSIAGVATGGGAVAVSGTVAGVSPATLTTEFALLAGVAGDLVWKTDTGFRLPSVYSTGGKTYVAVFNLNVIVAAGDSIMLYRGGWDLAEWWRVPLGFIDPAPRAAFSMTTSLLGASCGTTPTSPSTAVGGQTFPGASVSITNQSSGIVTSSTLTITRVTPTPATIYGPVSFSLGSTYTWNAPATTIPGEYHVTVTAADSGSGRSSTLVQSVFFCPEAARLAAPSTTSVLRGQTLTADARGSDGLPSGFTFVVTKPDSTTASYPVAASIGTQQIPFDTCGAHGVGVVANYQHAGNDSSCSGALAGYTTGNYDACATWPTVTSGLAALAFEVEQGASVIATAPASGSAAVIRSVATVVDATPTQLASGYTAAFQWLIGGAPACQSPYKPATGCMDTGSSYTIPADTMSVGVPVNVGLQVTLSGPPDATCDLTPDPITLTLNPVEVTADVSVNPSTANIGQAVTFTLTNVSGSFSSLSLNLGGATSCAGQTAVAICSGAQCVNGRQVQVPFQTPGTWQVRVVGTPAIGGSFSGPTHPVTINAVGSCTLSLSIWAAPNPATAGSAVTISFAPPVGSGSDQLTINFGDGNSQTLSGGICGLLGGCSSVSHAYSTAKTYTINASGTIGGVNYVGSTTVTISGTPPPAGGLTLSAAPNPVDEDVSTTISFSPAIATSGDTLTVNFNDGTSQTLSYGTVPCSSGGIFGSGGGCSSITHVFANPGTYTVSASGTISGQAKSGSTSVVVRSACTLPSAPAAGFTWAPLAGKVNQPIQFTDTSSGGPTTWSWEFGDGQGIFGGGSSSARNPAYTFTREGTFTVKLTATNCKGSSQITHPVTIGPECELAEAPVASFRLDTIEPRAKQPVQFTDQSTGTISTWLWEFGDGQGIFGGGTSTQQNPSYRYSGPGTYTVKLTVSNCKGQSTFELPVTIGEDNRPVSADFTWQPSAVTTGQEITFIALTGADYGDPDAFTWQFSDEPGTRSGAEIARTFECSGAVQLTLKAVRGSYSDIETKSIGIDGERCSPEAVVTTDAAKTAGANGTYWQTDLWVFNPSAQSTQVWLAVLNSGGDNAAPLISGPYPVGSKATLYLHNVLEVLSQQTGQDYRKGSIRVTFENADGVAPVVTARTFTPSPSLPGGNYGQSVRGVPVWPNTTAAVQWLTGVRNDGIASGFRTNFGLLNLRSDRSADPIVVTLYGGTGAQLGQLSFGLPPNGYIQDSVANLFGASLATIGPFSLKVEVGKQADVEANASVVENLTGDPMQVVAAVPQQTPLYLPAIARANGANNTVWRSSLQLTNPYDAARTWKVTYLPRGEGQAGVSRDLTLAGGQTIAFEDVVAWVFAPFGVPPPEQTAGVVKITPQTGLTELPVAVARTYNVTVQGTFGHAIPALYAALGASADSATTRLVLPGFSSEDVARSNLGFVNLNETGVVNFDVYFFGEDGTLLNPEGRPYVLALPAGGWDQDRIENRFNGFFGVPLPANLRAITAVVEVKTGSGGFAYASVVDNVTGDPIWISGQLLP